jgi:hypothetical protein
MSAGGTAIRAARARMAIEIDGRQQLQRRPVHRACALFF